MQFIIELLAKLFAAFKVKNPVVAGVILLVLGAIVHTTYQGETLGLFTLSPGLRSVVEIVGLLLTGITGSQTYQYLDGKK